MILRLKRSTSLNVAIVRVQAKPRSVRDAVLGVRAGLLVVSVTAAAEGGKANAAIERVLAATFGVPKSLVSVTRGHTARVKTVELSTVSDELVATIIGEYPAM